MPLIPKLSAVFIYTCNGKYSRKDIKRFIKYIKVNKKTGCWEWIGYKNKRGYGKLGIFKNNKLKHYSAHRIAVEMTTNRLIPNSVLCCHHCDNPQCVNVIECLFLGTHQDNMTDRNNKNRQAKYERNGSAKFNQETINKIRIEHATGRYTQLQLAKRFNTSQSVIAGIVNNKTWHDKEYIQVNYNHSRKFSQENIDTVRKLYSTGEYTLQQLANIIGSTRQNIHIIIKNKTWK